MQTALPARAARQRDVKRLGLELRLQFGIGQGVTPRIQRRLNRLLGQVDGGTPAFLFFNWQGRHALHQLGDTACLAQKQGFGVFQISGRDGTCECRNRVANH